MACCRALTIRKQFADVFALGNIRNTGQRSNESKEYENILMGYYTKIFYVTYVLCGIKIFP